MRKNCKKNLSTLSRAFAAALACLFFPQFAQADATLPTSYGFYNNPVAQTVSEMNKYKLVLSAANMADSDGNTGKLSWYDYTDYNNSLLQSGYLRAAFYLELTHKSSGATEWMLITMPNYITSGDYKSSDLLNLGIPNPTADANGVTNNYAIQKVVSDMNVYYVKPNASATNMPILSNIASVSDDGYRFVTGQTGTIEMWPSNYGGGASGNLSGITETGGYDWYDSGFNTEGGHGSYQIHLYDTTATAAPYGQTLFAINTALGGKQMGIGTNDGKIGSTQGTHPDWTFQYTSGAYSVKTLQIFAQPSISSDSMFWANASGAWSDTTWQDSTGAALATSPTAANDVVISSGTITVPTGTTASAKTLQVSEGATVDIIGSMSVAEDILTFAESTINLSGSLTTGSGGSITALNTTGAGAVSNASTSANLKFSNITGAAGSSLTLSGSKLTITGQTVSTPTLNLSDGSSVTLAPSTATAVSSAITGSGSLNQAGSQVRLSGDNTGYTGTYTVSAGALSVLSPNSLPSNYAVQPGASLNLYTGTGGFTQAQYDSIANGSQIGSESFLGVYTPTDQTLSLTINNNVNFSKTGSGTLTVTGSANSGYTGTTRVFEGALQIGNAAATGSLGGAIVVNSGTSTIFDLSAETNQTKVMTNYVSGAGSMIVRGGTLQFTTETETACAPYSSWTSASGTDTAVSLININTTIESGAKVYFADKVVPAASQNMTWTIESGGELEFNNTSSGASHFADNSLTGDGTSSSAYDNRSAGGSITINGGGTLTKTGNGAFALLCRYKSETVTMSLSEGGWIDVQGGTFINGGWSGNIAWGNNKGSVNLAAGTTLNLWDGNEITIDSLTGSGVFKQGHLRVGVANNVASEKFGVANNTATFSGVFGDGNARNLTKAGTGTQIMAGDNNYTGATTVSGGTLQFGNGGSTGKIGSGAVSVAAGTNLVFNTTRDNTVSGVLSGSGNLIQKGAGSTVTLTNAANTFSGAIDVQTGTLALGSAAGASGLGANAKISVASGAAINCYVPDSATTDLTSIKISGNGAFNKFGEGTATLGAQFSVGSATLNGGTTRFNTSKSLNSLNSLTVNENSTLALPAPVAQTFGETTPWTLTMYQGNSSNSAEAYTASSTIASGIKIYTGTTPNSGSGNVYSWSEYNANAVPTSYNMDQGANISTGDIRTYLPNYSSLSYTTDVCVTQNLVLDMGGFFDDYASISFYKMDADGNYDVSDTTYCMTSDFYASAYKYGMELPAGQYHLDVRVADRSGGAAPNATYVKDSAGKAIGAGIRPSTGNTTDLVYTRMDIDPATGNLAFNDNSILSVKSASDYVTELSMPINIADGKVLTVDNSFANSEGVIITSAISGTGTLYLTNSNEAHTPFTFSGATAGSITVADTVGVFTITEGSTIAGDLVLVGNSNLVAQKNVSVSGNVQGTGIEYNIIQATGVGVMNIAGAFEADDWKINVDIDNLEAPLDFTADTTSLSGTQFAFKYEGESFIGLENWLFMNTNDATEQWDPSLISFSLPDSMKAYASFAEGNYYVNIGDASSVPEPSACLLLVLGLSGIWFVSRKRKG